MFRPPMSFIANQLRQLSTARKLFLSASLVMAIGVVVATRSPKTERDADVSPVAQKPLHAAANNTAKRDLRPPLTKQAAVANLTKVAPFFLQLIAHGQTLHQAAHNRILTSDPPPNASPRERELWQQHRFRHTWTAIAPTLQRADQQRHKAVAESIKQLKDLTRSIANPTGTHAFIDAALGSQSKYLSVKDQSEHRRWLREQLAVHVFPADEYQQLVAAHGQALHSTLGQIDNDALIALQADVDLDPATDLLPQTTNNKIMRGIKDYPRGSHVVLRKINQACREFLLARLKRRGGYTRRHRRESRGRRSFHWH